MSSTWSVPEAGGLHLGDGEGRGEASSEHKVSARSALERAACALCSGGARSRRKVSARSAATSAAGSGGQVASRKSVVSAPKNRRLKQQMPTRASKGKQEQARSTQSSEPLQPPLPLTCIPSLPSHQPLLLLLVLTERAVRPQQLPARHLRRTPSRDGADKLVAADALILVGVNGLHSNKKVKSLKGEQLSTQKGLREVRGSGVEASRLMRSSWLLSMACTIGNRVTS